MIDYQKYQFNLNYYYTFFYMGSYLSQPQTEKSYKQGMNEYLTYCSVSMQGWRKTMEDTQICQESLGNGNSLFAIFDGHGGHQVSGFAKNHFVDILTQEEAYKKGLYAQALKQTFKKIDKKLYTSEGLNYLMSLRNSQNNSSQKHIADSAGCTANVILITNDKIYCANAGDSRSVLCKAGQAINLSNDHKPEDQKQLERIKNAGAQIKMGRINGGLNLSRAFGDFNYKGANHLPYTQQAVTCHPQIIEFLRSEEDQFILMGCDGIWQRFPQSSQGIIDVVKIDQDNGKCMKKTMEDLLNLLIGKDSKQILGLDNMTATIVRFF